MNEPTYVFEGGHVYTMVGGKVVASVKEADFTDPQGAGDPGIHHDPVAMPDPPPDIQNDLGGMSGGPPCPGCQSPTEGGDKFCSHCGSPLDQPGVGGDLGEVGYGGRGENMGEGIPEPQGLDRPMASVVTPNGVKGTILGKGMWDDEVTVRLENGRIVRVAVHDIKVAAEEATTPEAPKVQQLDERLAVTYDTTRGSLAGRANDLKTIKSEAIAALAKASYDDQQTLHGIVVQAEYELAEVGDAMAQIDSDAVEAYQPPTPQVVEQESVGGGDASWLDHTVQDMIAEAEATNYEQLMDEGPEAFVAELDDAAVADGGVTRQMASRWIHSKTAGADESLREKYQKTWLTRVEEVRRSELANRKQATHQKEAATQESDYSDLPDDVLFS